MTGADRPNRGGIFGEFKSDGTLGGLETTVPGVFALVCFRNLCLKSYRLDR